MTTPAPSRGRRRRVEVAAALGLVAAGAAAVVGAACTTVPTDPTAVFSLSVDSLPGPSVVAGDTLRDTSGVVRALTGHAFNIQGQVLPNVVVRFISLSPSQLLIDAANHAIGAPSGDSVVRVVADAQGLQSLPFLVPVVLRPTSMVHADSDSISTLALSLSSADSNVSPPLNLILQHQPDSAGADSVTRSYIVHYQVTYPASAAKGTGTASDTLLPAYLIDASGTPARTDTTDGNGVGSRRLLFSVPRIPFGTRDSVVVMATATFRDSAVAGSPLRFVVHYTAPH